MNRSIQARLLDLARLERRLRLLRLERRLRLLRLLRLERLERLEGLERRLRLLRLEGLERPLCLGYNSKLCDWSNTNYSLHMTFFQFFNTYKSVIF